MKPKIIETLGIFFTVSIFFVIMILLSAQEKRFNQQPSIPISNDQHEMADKKEEERIGETIDSENTEELKPDSKNPPRNPDSKPVDTPQEPPLNPATPSPTLPVTPTPDIKPELTQAEKNNQLRKTLEEKYDFNLKYGKEMPNYKPRGKVPNYLTDEDQIATILTSLKEALLPYPTNLFREIKQKKGMNLTILLIDSDPLGRFAGMVDQQFYSDLKLVLTNQKGLYFSKTFNHEMMHYMDAFMSVQSYNNYFSAWEQYFPSNFTYGSSDNAFVCYQDSSVAFVSIYGKTNELEDRATIFEDILFRPYLLERCYGENQILRKKAIYLFEEIDRVIESVTPSTLHKWAPTLF